MPGCAPGIRLDDDWTRRVTRPPTVAPVGHFCNDGFRTAGLAPPQRARVVATARRGDPALGPRAHKEWQVTIDGLLGAAPAGPSNSELVQLLTPEGERTEHPEYPLDLSPEEVRAFYRDLVLVRRMDFEATALQRHGELGIWASLLGQEAAQIGSGRALAEGDMVFPSYREHGVAWCRGIDPMALLSLFRGVDYGGWDPARHNFHLYTIVVGGQTLHATGYAMGLQRDGTEAAVLVYFGDGATSQGDVNEAFVWASVFNAPVVFFCQNNQWAISEPQEKQSRIPLYQRARGFGFPGVRVDGNDVFACLAVTRKALQAAREGQGPTLIEAYTYRMGPHTTTDDPTRYRLESELEAWKLKDPIERVKAYLIRRQLADQSFLGEIDREADEFGARLRKSCVQMPEPPPMSIFDHVFVGEHPILAEERDGFEAYLASFADGGR
ncbi:MAG: pyruvate dehydrogenase (acetyl-transferring) E1 component subunit alpha [Streptosporangiales bacterium]|nr:pyruvate dehydrogenase (acetyl-transferring) E1 component subunit alpha [Streptosporangiales bacterium]